MVSVNDENDERRDEEWDALVAFYGDEMVSGSFSSDATAQDISDTASGSSCRCWSIQIVPPNITLELQDIPRDYPGGPNPPRPKLNAPQWIMDEIRQAELQQELLTLFEPDTEVAIMWVEHCRSVIEEYQEANQISKIGKPVDYDEHQTESSENNVANNAESSNAGGHQPQSSAATISFVPSSKYGQSIRNFQLSIVDNPTYQREIHHGVPFHPPKSGPSETMQSHVA